MERKVLHYLNSPKILSFCRSNIEKIVLIFLSLAWIPLPFYNFDSHHDGLILSTVTLTKSALIGGGEYPFNQYGPIWVLPFVILSFILNSELLFIGMRILTVGIYFLSAFLLWRTSRYLVDSKMSIFTVVLFFASQPFTTDYGSTLVPWPSAIVMPLVIAAAFLMIKIFDEEIQKRNKEIFAFGIGLLIPAIIGSRIQVGVLLLGVAIYAIQISGFSRFRHLYLLLGLFTSTGVVTLAFIRLGWLKSALFDQIIYGATYLTADKSTYPKPTITVLGILIFTIFFTIAPLIFRLKNKFTNKAITLLCLLLTIAFIVFAVTVWPPRSVEPINVLVTLIRRVWITFSLGALLYFVLKIFIFERKEIKLKSDTSERNQFRILALSALCFETQVFPLFDQMHFWWGSPLTFVIVVMVTVERYKIYFSQPRILKLKYFLLVIFMISVFVPWSDQVGARKTELPDAIAANIYSSQSKAIYHQGLQQFFDRNIIKGERVLNLCEDTDVFFEQYKYFSASRFFVYWGEPMSHSDEIYNSFINSKPDAIVTCELVHRPTIRLKEESLQRAILVRMNVDLDSGKSFLGEKRWTIYRY